MLTMAHPGTVLRFIRTLPLASSPRVGQISWRDAAISTGAIENPGPEKPTPEATVRAAFMDSDRARLEALRAAAASIAESAAAICATFDARAGYGTSPDYEEFTKLVKDVARTIERYRPAEEAAPETSEATEVAAESEPGAADAGAAAPSARRAGPVTASSLTEISTRADAMRLLDLCIRYYQRYEPASPLPMLIERARGLADKSFLDIVRELAPDGVAQVRNIVGARDE
jgi:type VI secretion system protein ImpA